MGQPKDKRENKRIRRGQKQGKGGGQPKEKAKKWMSMGLKQGAGWENLRKKRENKLISRD